MRWRLLQTPPLDGPANMALDHALMARARGGDEAVLRIYEWSVPVMSLGRNQRGRGVYLDDELARRGIMVVRRPTGGRALLHHREITYSLTAPHAGERVGVMYRRMNGLLLEALEALGVSGVLARPTSGARLPTSTPCFAEPSTGEIVVAGRKLVGSAQWRDDGALLQHGSILVENDQRVLPMLMLEPGTTPPEPATLQDILGRTPEAGEMARALFDAVRRMEDPGVSKLSGDEQDAIDSEPFLEIYRDPAWTWRR